MLTISQQIDNIMFPVLQYNYCGIHYHVSQIISNLCFIFVYIAICAFVMNLHSCDILAYLYW